METTEIIRILRQCGDCCLSHCEDCPEYKKAEEGFRKDPDAKGFMWSCGGVLLEVADRLALMEDIRKDIWDITNEKRRLVQELETLRAERHGEVEPARWEWGRHFGAWGIFCSNCGTGWQDDDGYRMVGLAESHKYCPNCGKPMLFDEEADWVAQDVDLIAVEEDKDGTVHRC